MENAPPVWGTIVHHSTMADIEEVLNAINTSQTHLHKAWFQSHRWGSRDRGPRGGKCTYKAARVASDDKDPLSPESLGLSDLEGYEDSDREAFFNHRNKPSSSNPRWGDTKAQTYPFSPQDQVVSKSKRWLRDCPKRGDYDKLKENKLVKGPSKAYKIAMYAMEASWEASEVHPTRTEERGFA